MSLNKNIIQYLIDQFEEPFPLHNDFITGEIKSTEQLVRILCYDKLINLEHYVDFIIANKIDLEEEQEYILEYVHNYFNKKFGIAKPIDAYRVEIKRKVLLKGYSSVTAYLRDNHNIAEYSNYFKKYTTVSVRVPHNIKVVCEDLGIDSNLMHYSILVNSIPRYINRKLEKIR